MKLSEAIMLGSTLRRQARGSLFRNGGSCAFGAAAEAIGAGFSLSINKEWPWLEKPLICPECGKDENWGACVISHHLNDTHEWTRERIAEWVATVEPQESVAADSLYSVSEHAFEHSEHLYGTENVRG